MITLRLLIRLSRPPLLLIAALLYFMGAGVARYLGVSIDWGMYLLGQAWLLLVQFVIHALNEYFELPVEQRTPGSTLLLGSSGVLELGKLPRPIALWGSAACALTAGLLAVLIIIGSTNTLESLVIQLVLVLTGLVYSIPPLRLSASGYGELLLSFFLATLVPIFSFTLQGGELHRLLPMVTFPLVCFFLALLLIVEFPDYATDSKYEKTTLLQRLGWQGGMALHNVLIFGGFALLVLAVIFGLPWRIFLPVVTVVPVGFVQIWLLNRIRLGVRPNWKLMLVVASATFGLTAYFLAYGFWTH